MGFFPVSAAFAGSGDISLRQAVLLMLEYEPELNAAEYDTLSAIADHRLARSERRPLVNVNTGVGYVDRDRSTDALSDSGETLLQREIGITVRQLLYDGGMSKNNILAARNTHLAQQLTEKSMIESRTVDLSEVYLEVIRVRRQIDLAQRNVENHRAIRDMLRERVAMGGRRADVGLVQGRLQLAINTLSNQNLALQRAIARFERLTGVTPGNLSYPGIPSLPSDWKNIDTSRNFDYLAAAQGLEAAEHRYLAAKGRKYPKLYFETGASRGRDTLGIRGRDDEKFALITGSWDIFSGGRNRAFECREHFQVGKFEELVRSADRERNYRLKLLWQEREGSIASISALDRYAKELARVNSDYEEQFKIGHQELINILDIQQEYYSVKSRLLDAKFEKDQSVYRIMGVQGILTAELIGACKFDTYCKSPVGECKEKCHPDNRVPVTQSCLIAGKFDCEGPKAEVCPVTHQTYYKDRPQLPVVCDPKGKCGSCNLARKLGFGKCKECNRRGGLFRLFKK